MKHPFEKEDRAFLAALKPVPQTFRGFGRPAEVAIDWHRTENQGQIGSCQGNDLTSCMERLVYVATRKQVQLSRMYAYLRTQQIDGLLGNDVGSTISGGGKVALEGVPLESLTGYPQRYPDSAERRRILAVSDKPYTSREVRACPEGADAAMDLIGGGAAISIGIPWYSGIIPRDRIVRSFNPPRREFGGHAMAVLGYSRDGRLRAVNSHADGPYEITPEAWAAMQRHSYTAMIVLLGSEQPAVDWAKERYL